MDTAPVFGCRDVLVCSSWTKTSTPPHFPLSRHQLISASSLFLQHFFSLLFDLYFSRFPLFQYCITPAKSHYWDSVFHQRGRRTLFLTATSHVSVCPIVSLLTFALVQVSGDISRSFGGLNIHWI